MKEYKALFSHYYGKVSAHWVTFSAYNIESAKASAQRYARDFSLHLDAVKEAA